MLDRDQGNSYGKAENSSCGDLSRAVRDYHRWPYRFAKSGSFAVRCGERAQHLGLLAVMVIAGLLSVPAPHEAAAAPVTTAAPQIPATLATGSIERIYYYRGGYYPYSYRGMYFRHRYYRYGRYHYC